MLSRPQVSFNPTDSAQVCVSGKYVFKIFLLNDDLLVETSAFEMDLENVESHAWLSEGSVVLGTQTGNLMLFKTKALHYLGRPFKR